ncbi:MAG: CidA/LrgA family protein [Firmicutes bacterium]|nr:CidA/LrgA family protein [Bacillota bacterium]
MKILKQLAAISAVCIAGEAISALLPVTFPGSVISMIIVFLLLFFKFIKEEAIKETSDFLLGNMAFFFVPAATAIIEKYDFLKGSIMIIVFISIICTFITFIVTYYTVCFVSYMQNRRCKK